MQTSDAWHIDKGGSIRDENGLLVRPAELLAAREQRDLLLDTCRRVVAGELGTVEMRLAIAAAAQVQP